MLCVHDALNSWSRSSSCRRKRQLDSSSFLSSFLPLYTWRTGHAPPARIFALSCWATGLSASNRKTILSSPLFFLFFFFSYSTRSTAPPYERQTELLCSLLLHAHVGAETVTESPLVSPLGGWRAVRTTLHITKETKWTPGEYLPLLNIFIKEKKRALIIFSHTIDPDAQDRDDPDGFVMWKNSFNVERVDYTPTRPGASMISHWKTLPSSSFGIMDDPAWSLSGCVWQSVAFLLTHTHTLMMRETDKSS